MTRDQEKLLDAAIYDSMRELRDASIAIGMKAALGAVLGIIEEDDGTAEYKLNGIKDFCEKALNNGKDRQEGTD